MKSPEIRHRVEQFSLVNAGCNGATSSSKTAASMPNVAAPLVRQGEVRGWIVAPIDVLTLSAIARDLSDRFDTTAFIIDGDNHVLAHKRLLSPRPAKWQAEPTIPLAEFDDPVLAHYAERVAVR